MITVWVKNMLLSLLPGNQAQEVGQGAQAFEKRAKARLGNEEEDEITSPDSEETRQKSIELLSKAPKEGSKVDRIRTWMNVRRGVRKELDECYKMPEIMEEVTEKLREAAANDTFYKKWFLK